MHGMVDEASSESIQVRPGQTPPPPVLSGQLIGVSDRMKLQQNLVELLNQRDAFIREIYQHRSSLALPLYIDAATANIEV